MIFVTVGTDRAYGFNRLVEACDKLAPSLPQPMIIQIAASTYQPKNAGYFRYVPVNEYLEHFQKANLIISHCSSGPVLNASRFEKPLIIMPRRSAYGEFADEHQLDFARSLEEKNISSVQVLYETGELEAAVRKMLELKSGPPAQSEGLKAIIHTIKDFIHASDR